MRRLRHRLAFVERPTLSELRYETAAMAPGVSMADSPPPVRVAVNATGDGSASILAIARGAISNPAEQAGCSVRKADVEYWPADAQVVDVSAAQAAAAAQDGPRSACGEFGYNGDEASYWRVFQGRAWFFQLGQDAAQFDPGSFTLMTKDASGGWTQVP